MISPDVERAARQCVLAASVLHDVDVVPAESGVRLTSRNSPLVTWDQIAETIGVQVTPFSSGYSPRYAATASFATSAASSAAQRRVAILLKLVARFDAMNDAQDLLQSAARVVALPAGHAEHGGPRWVRERLLGGALDLGLGVMGLLDDPDEVVTLSQTALDVCVLGTGPVWDQVRDHAERMGALAAQRVTRDGTGGGRAVLRPVGGCDVLALLSSAALRQYLAAVDGTGLTALAVPMRSRGWFDVSRIDPAFVGAAWTATDEGQRGLPLPILVTAHEVSLARQDGDPVTEGLDRPRDISSRRRRPRS